MCLRAAQAEPPLTLEDCLAEAAAGNPDLVAAREAVQTPLSDAPQKSNPFMPFGRRGSGSSGGRAGL